MYGACPMKLLPLLLCLNTGLSSAVVESPNGAIKATFSLTEDGTPQYAVTFKGKPVIGASSLGLELQEGGNLQTGFEMLSATPSSA